MILGEETKPLLDTLAHYGVKGMKWGVRRDLEKQAAVARSAFAQVGRQAIAYSTREITEQEYKSLSSKPITLSDANGSFHRVVKSSDAKLRDGMVYVTRDQQDNTNYVALFPPEGNGRNSQKFAATVKVSKAVVSPALKERVDTFVKTMDMDIPLSGVHGESTINGRAFLTGATDRSHENVAFRALSNQQLGLKYYQTWVQSQHMNDPLNQVYTSELRKKGYNAIIDDADTGLMSQVPIILFPKESGAHITEITPITKDDELIARANLKAPQQINHKEAFE